MVSRQSDCARFEADLMSGNPFLHLSTFSSILFPRRLPRSSNAKLFKESPQWVKESERESRRKDRRDATPGALPRLV